MQSDSGAARSRVVYSVLLAISMAFIATGIGILLFSDIPRFDQFLWAAGLGLAAAMLASDNSKPREQEATSQVSLA
jgi:hypothetical protein